MRSLILALVSIAAISTFAAEGKPVTYPSGNERVAGILYLPQGKASLPSLVVIHEWWGLNDWVKEQASRLADEGYVALAIDLYRGKVASSAEEAHELMRGVPADRATQDLLAATAFLRSRKDTDPARVASIGWCMGGGYSFDLAVNDPKLKAAVINYGHVSSASETLNKINAAVLGVFGGQDRGIPVSDVRAFEQQMKKLGKKIEVVIFPDAGHAFENPNNKAGYRADDAAEAWRKTVEFLAANLMRTAPR